MLADTMTPRPRRETPVATGAYADDPGDDASRLIASLTALSEFGVAQPLAKVSGRALLDALREVARELDAYYGMLEQALASEQQPSRYAQLYRLHVARCGDRHHNEIGSLMERARRSEPTRGLLTSVRACALAIRVDVQSLASREHVGAV